MKTSQQILKATSLEREINKLIYFTECISSRLPGKLDKRFSGIILKIQSVTKLSLFGSEYFGCGSHKEEVDIPPSLLGKIHQIALDELQRKQKELQSMFK